MIDKINNKILSIQAEIAKLETKQEKYSLVSDKITVDKEIKILAYGLEILNELLIEDTVLLKPQYIKKVKKFIKELRSEIKFNQYINEILINIESDLTNPNINDQLRKLIDSIILSENVSETTIEKLLVLYSETNSNKNLENQN